jgi:hypothetical protein
LTHLTTKARCANSRGREYPDDIQSFIQWGFIMSNKTDILKRIGSIGKRANALRLEVQEVATDCALHAVQHGDVTLADQLVEALGKGMRRASLRAWFEKNTPMYLPKGKDKFAFDSDRAKEMREVGLDVVREQLAALPWEEAKPEEAVVSVFDVEQAFDKFMKRIDATIKDVNVTVRNRALLEQLAQTASIYHAEKVLNQRIAMPDTAE